MIAVAIEDARRRAPKGVARGISRERRVRENLQSDGWVVIRAAGSLGCADLVALKGGDIWLVEIKSTAGGPYEHFGPANRKALSTIARKAGARAWLVHWPKRGRCTWLAESDWPVGRP